MCYEEAVVEMDIHVGDDNAKVEKSLRNENLSLRKNEK
jgi:hypothetical protein